jgi:hypothetical protein
MGRCNCRQRVDVVDVEHDGFAMITPDSSNRVVQFFSVSAKQADLAKSLAERATGRPVPLTLSEVKVLRKPPRPGVEAGESQWQVAVAMLRDIGVSMPGSGLTTN